MLLFIQSCCIFLKIRMRAIEASMLHVSACAELRVQVLVTQGGLQVGLGKPFKYVVTCVIMQRK